MTPVELEHFFATRGKELLFRFYVRVYELKKSAQRRGNRMVKLNETESKVYELIQRGCKDTNAMVARTGKSRRVINQAVHKLMDVGYVQRLGHGRTTTYRVMNKGA